MKSYIQYKILHSKKGAGRKKLIALMMKIEIHIHSEQEKILKPTCPVGRKIQVFSHLPPLEYVASLTRIQCSLINYSSKKIINNYAQILN